MNAYPDAAADQGLKEAIRLVLPKEHGSWSLALEPVALGLLVAPTQPGCGLAVAAVAGFFLRHPLKLLLQAKPDARRATAQSCVAALLALALTGLALAFHGGTGERLWPLLPAGGAGLAFVWFDARGENRAGMAEIAGATAFAFLPAAFASLAGWSPAKALALSAVMLARSVPTVMLVRTLLRRAKGQSVHPQLVLAVTVAAAAMSFWLAGSAWIPWLPAVVSGLLLARAGWFLSANSARFSARKLGVMELILGVGVVLSAALAWHF